MKKLNSTNEFVVGKNNIGFVSSDFKTRFPDIDFEPKTLGSFQTLKRGMTDADIESELKPGICDLGDVYAFLQNPPQGTKNGDWNLFYTPSFVMYVRWDADSGYWIVNAWGRDGFGWSAGIRVFSPATVEFGSLSSVELSDTLSFAIRVCKDNGLVVSREQAQKFLDYNGIKVNKN